jgi:hypothetical protein
VQKAQYGLSSVNKNSSHFWLCRLASAPAKTSSHFRSPPRLLGSLPTSRAAQVGDDREREEAAAQHEDLASMVGSSTRAVMCE